MLRSVYRIPDDSVGLVAFLQAVMGLKEQKRRTKDFFRPTGALDFGSDRYQGLTPLAIIYRSFGAKSLSESIALLASLAVCL